MIRALVIATIATVGLSFSALAADEAAAPEAGAADAGAFTAQLSTAANAGQVRQMLQAQGYTSVSDLTLNETGRWVGSAVKDGKTVGVSVALPKKGAETPATTTN